MILGSAILPPVQSTIADHLGIHVSYFVPVIGFSYLLFFSWKVSKQLKAQGFDTESIKDEGGH